MVISKSPWIGVSAALLCAFSAASVQADVVGFRLGVNAWLEGYEGDVQSGPTSIDIEDELGYDDETGYNAYFQLEHPVPVLPNVMVAYTKMDSDASGRLDNVEFDGILYSGDVNSTTDITHTDLTLYYEVLDGPVNIDLGLTGRYFPEGVEITDVTTGEQGKIDLDYVIPMLYGEIRFDLPLTGLSAGASGGWVSYDDDTLYDVKATLAYTFAFGLGIEAGYRAFDLDYEDDDESADVTVDGAFAGVFWDF